MARYREPNICPKCGEVIKAIYKDQSTTPSHLRIIGDTFLGYENHKCNPTILKLTEENIKLREDIEKLKNGKHGK